MTTIIPSLSANIYAQNASRQWHICRNPCNSCKYFATKINSPICSSQPISCYIPTHSLSTSGFATQHIMKMTGHPMPLLSLFKRRRFVHTNIRPVFQAPKRTFINKDTPRHTVMQILTKTFRMIFSDKNS